MMVWDHYLYLQFFCFWNAKWNLKNNMWNLFKWSLKSAFQKYHFSLGHLDWRLTPDSLSKCWFHMSLWSKSNFLWTELLKYSRFIYYFLSLYTYNSQSNYGQRIEATWVMRLVRRNRFNTMFSDFQFNVYDMLSCYHTDSLVLMSHLVFFVIFRIFFFNYCNRTSIYCVATVWTPPPPASPPLKTYSIITFFLFWFFRKENVKPSALKISIWKVSLPYIMV